MRDVVIELGGKNDTLLNKDIEELIEFEKELAEVIYHPLITNNT